MKPLSKRISSLEQRVSALEPKAEKESLWPFTLLFLILLPIEIPLYIVWAFFYALLKPFLLLNLSKKEQENYKIEGEFNPCEYMWSSISPRYDPTKVRK